MRDAALDFWTDDTSVLFTSFYGWTPDTWGTVGWTGDRGLGRRNNLLNEMSDPFITVCSVTSNTTYGDPALKGMIAGFYLVTHELGDRTEFTHPTTHALWPGKWQHSLRATRAFSYLPEYRLRTYDFDPTIRERALHVAAMGEILTDIDQVKLLRETPWTEVDVYASAKYLKKRDHGEEVGKGLVKPGPLNAGGYVVPPSTRSLDYRLYVLRLDGDTDAFLGRSAEGRSIYKIGVSVSPDFRRQVFQKAMPRGAFEWKLERPAKHADGACYAFNFAVAGEDAIKKHLAGCAKWLGGEFYLATEEQIDEAWQVGHAVSQSFS